jgi:hypothetical protein
MMKSLASLALLGLLGSAVLVLPGFAPRVAAGEAAVPVKADRLEIPTAARNCTKQVWPGFDAHCLHGSQTGMVVREVRLVTARR